MTLERSEVSSSLPIGESLLYGRPEDGFPLLPGDRIARETLGAFTFRSSQQPDEEGDDFVLWEAYKALSDVPATLQSVTGLEELVRRNAESWDRCGEMAPAPLERGGKIQFARAISADLAEAFEKLFLVPEKPWTVAGEGRCISVCSLIVDALDQMGYLIWVVGGPVRDLIDGCSPELVNDLDLAGTSPPATFCKAAHSALVRAGLGDLRFKVSPHSLVCFLTPPNQTTRAIEYKPLVSLGFPDTVPACGSNFSDDVSTRDLTINCLFYDPLRRAILDPTGRGIDDVVEHRLDTPNSLSSPTEQVNILFRTMKVLLKSAGGNWAVTPELRQYIVGLPQRIDLDACNWKFLRIRYESCSRGFALRDIEQALRPFGSGVVALAERARTWPSDDG
jgi:hypothetical protein